MSYTLLPGMSTGSRSWAISCWVLAASAMIGGAWYALRPLAVPVRNWNDFAFVYAAGRAWSRGLSPYDVERWRAQWVAIRPAFLPEPPTQPYLYPPHWIVLAVPLSLLPWPVAERFWDVIDVAAYAAACALTLRLLVREQEGALRKPLTWVLVGLAALNGATRWCFWECQLATVSFLGVVGAFWAWSEKRTSWLAVSVFVAALKPQLAALPLLFLLLNGGERGVLRGVAAALAVSALAVTEAGPWQFLDQVRSDYRLHMAISFNAPGRFYSVSALFAAVDPEARLTRVSTLIGAGAIAWITWVGSPTMGRPAPGTSTLWPLALSLTLTAAFVPLHGYDLVIYTPLIVMAGLLQPRWLAALVVALALSASRVPRLGDALHLGPLVPYVTLTVALATALAWRLSGSVAPAPPEPEAASLD